MANITNKDQTVIGQRVVIDSDNGPMKATVSGYPFKTKNFIAVIYDGVDAKGNAFKPMNLDLDVYGAFIRSTRGRRPNSANELPGAQTLVGGEPVKEAKTPTRAPKATATAPVQVAATNSRKSREVAAPAATPAKSGRGGGIANSGSGKLMKIAGSKAHALGVNPTEEGLADLLATIESGMRAEFGIGKQNSRKRREVAAAPVATPAPAKAPRQRAAAAPVAPAPVAKPAPRKAAPVAAAAPAMRAAPIGRRPTAPMA